MLTYKKLRTEVVERLKSYADKQTGFNRAKALLCLAHLYGGSHGMKTDNALSKKYYDDSVQLKHPSAQIMVARNYRFGTAGYSKDHNRAYKLYKNAAASGDTWAYLGLGYCYRDGTGVTKSHSNAVYYFKQAADQGSQGAIIALAYIYKNQSDHKNAWDYFSRSARAGDMSAECELGNMLYNGTGNNGRTDFNGAFKRFKKASEHNLNAMYMTGLCYLEGKGTFKNSVMAETCFKQVVESKFWTRYKVDAQLALGKMYKNGVYANNKTLIKRDNQKAVNLFKKAADSGNPEAQYELGDMYNRGLIVSWTESPVHAVKWLSKASDQGHIEASHKLGVIYLNGSGQIKKDLEKSLIYYKRAAEKGHGKSQNWVGLAYDMGRAVAVNKTIAGQWYLKSAQNGYVWGQHNIASFYEYGTGMSKNEAKAFEWHKKAAAQDNPNSQYDLGRFYYYGKANLNVDRKEAVRWYTKSAKNGFSSAQNALANCYANVEGVNRDYKQAEFWYLRAWFNYNNPIDNKWNLNRIKQHLPNPTIKSLNDFTISGNGLITSGSFKVADSKVISRLYIKPSNHEYATISLLIKTDNFTFGNAKSFGRVYTSKGEGSKQAPVRVKIDFRPNGVFIYKDDKKHYFVDIDPNDYKYFFIGCSSNSEITAVQNSE